MLPNYILHAEAVRRQNEVKWVNNLDNLSFCCQTHYYDDASAKQHTKPIQKFLGFGKVVLMLEQSPFWINNTRWWTKCTLKRQKVSSWHHFFKEGKITVSPQLTSKNRNSISKALSSLKFPCSFGITLLGHFLAPLSFQLLLLFPIYIVIGVKRDFTIFVLLPNELKF